VGLQVCARLPIAPAHVVQESLELVQRDLAVVVRVHHAVKVLRLLLTLFLRGCFLSLIFHAHPFREINQLLLSDLAATIRINHVEKALLNLLVADIRIIRIVLVVLARFA